MGRAVWQVPWPMGISGSGGNGVFPRLQSQGVLHLTLNCCSLVHLPCKALQLTGSARRTHCSLLSLTRETRSWVRPPLPPGELRPTAQCASKMLRMRRFQTQQRELGCESPEPDSAAKG